MNLPISLTLLRIFFVPIVVVLLLTKGGHMLYLRDDARATLHDAAASLLER